MEIPYAQNEDGTPHEYSFELARDKDDKESSYEEDNGKHWVKLFSTFDGSKNIFDHEEVPDGTAKIKVVFDITNYDLDEAYPLTWATGIGGGWTSGKPTGVTINQSGTYEAVLDFASETDGIGRTLATADLTTASLQLVFQLGASGQENIANVKKTKVTFKACYAYDETEAEDVTQAEVIPIEDETPSTSPTQEPSTKPSVEPSILPSASPSIQTTAAPTGTPDNVKNSLAPKQNKVKKIKPVKKNITIKKGKKKSVSFQITATDNNKKTSDKIVQAKVSNKKVAKVIKKSLSKKKCTIKLKGLKKGKTTLTLKIGSQKAKVKIQVK